jgi:xylan 1,4-beta-xylosidase
LALHRSGELGAYRRGYENGFRTLGRQALLEPIEWTEDDWFRAKGGDLSQPMAKPRNGKTGPSGTALSDDFSSNKFGIQWAFHSPGPGELKRVTYGDKALSLTAAGSSPADSSPLTCGVVDRAYQVEVSLKLQGEAEAGLLLFYNHKAFVGMGFNSEAIKSFQYAEEQSWARIPLKTRSLRMRITNDHQVITYEYSQDAGRTWVRHPTRMEVSGLNHNVFGGFLSSKVGIYCAGSGKVQLSDYRYRALSDTHQR